LRPDAAPRPGLRTTKGNEQFNQAVGSYSLYLVVDDPDAHHNRANQAGAEILLGLKDEDYGSRGYTARDEASVPAPGTPPPPRPGHYKTMPRVSATFSREWPDSTVVRCCPSARWPWP
jgi:hypothetical protein